MAIISRRRVTIAFVYLAAAFAGASTACVMKGPPNSRFHMRGLELLKHSRLLIEGCNLRIPPWQFGHEVVPERRTPEGVELLDGFSLLLDPGEVLEVVDGFALEIAQLPQMICGSARKEPFEVSGRL